VTLRRPSAESILLGAILLVGAISRCWGVAFGLPNTTVHPDEGAIVGISSGMLYAGYNPGFFHWPSFEFYVVAACYRIGWQIERWRGVFHHNYEITPAVAAHPAPFILVPRMLAVVAGVATIWCVYRFARQSLGRATALVASFFLAIAFLHVRDSHFGVTDAPMTYLAMAAMIPIGRALVDPSTRRHWIVAGMLTGLTASTKYNGGLMAAVAFAVAAIVWIDGRGGDAPLRRSAAIRGLIWFTSAAALAFVAGTPYSVLDFQNFLEGLRFDSTHLMAGHGEILGRGWIYHVLFSLRYGIGAPMLVAAIAGIVVLAIRSWRTAVLVCTFPIIYYLLVGRGYTVFVRYVTPLVPFLCMTAAVAVVAVARRLARPWPAAVPAATGVLAVLIAVPSIQSTVAFDALAGRADTRLVAAAWLDARRQSSDWLNEEFPAFLHPEWGRAPGVNVSRFDAGRGAFISGKGAEVTPDWIALGSSALPVYANLDPQILPLIAGTYELAATFRATSGPESPEIFDRQDHFFFPYADFSRRLRSGPDIRIYRRVR
jgi:hypothetical protein